MLDYYSRLRTIYRVGLRLTIRWIFLFLQSLGIHVVPNHFHEPVPDTRYLSDKLWEQPTEHVGIDLNEREQLALLTAFVSAYRDEYNSFPREAADTTHPYDYYVNNGMFGAVDGEILYCIIRHFKPRRVF